MIITSEQYISKEQLESDISTYAAELLAHAQTVGVPAPWPPNDIVEHIVKNNIAWTWEQLPEPTQAVSNTVTQVDGFEFVADLYNDFLAKKFYYDELDEYQQLRFKEYPSVGDQLDALFKSGVFPANMSDAIRAVKNKYPKPSPYPSWIWNTTSCLWEPPVAYPTDGKQYLWDEDTTSWVEVK